MSDVRETSALFMFVDGTFVINANHFIVNPKPLPEPKVTQEMLDAAVQHAHYDGNFLSFDCPVDEADRLFAEVYIIMEEARRRGQNGCDDPRVEQQKNGGR